MQNAGVFVPRHTDQPAPRSLQGAMSMHRPNPGSRAVSAHKHNRGFTQVKAQKQMHTEWRNWDKDQMMASGLLPVG